MTELEGRHGAGPPAVQLVPNDSLRHLVDEVVMIVSVAISCVDSVTSLSLFVVVDAEEKEKRGEESQKLPYRKISR